MWSWLSEEAAFVQSWRCKYKESSHKDEAWEKWGLGVIQKKLKKDVDFPLKLPLLWAPLFTRHLFPVGSPILASTSSQVTLTYKILVQAWSLERYDSCSVMPDSLTPWSIAHQAPLSMEFSRQEYWNRFPFPSPGDLPNPEIKPASPAIQVDSLPYE